MKDFVCSQCGSTSKLSPSAGVTVCSACFLKDLTKTLCRTAKVSEFEEVESTTHIVCPYCYYEVWPEVSEGDYEEGEYGRTCGKCGKAFNVQVDVSVSWTSIPKENQK